MATMKHFTVTLATIGRGPKMRTQVMARTSDSAWSKAYRIFCRRHPRAMARRMSIGGAVSA